MTSGVVGLITPENLLAWENPKRWRESREILKILQFQKELKKKHPETFQKRGSGKSSDPTKIRIRALSGSAKGKTLTLSNTSIQFLWGGWGIGQTTMKFEKSKSGKEFSISNSFNDISYTFGEEISFTIGTGVLGSGKGTYKESQKEFTSELASGSANFFSIGIEFSGIEFLYGQRKFDFENKEFQRIASGTKETVESNVKVNGTIHLFGIGVSF